MRWAASLGRPAIVAVILQFVKFAAIPMRILFLTSRFPYPLEKGDKLRAYHQIKQFSTKHEVILAAVSDTRVEPAQLEALKPYCRKIIVCQIGRGRILWNLVRTLFSGLPFQVGYFYSPSFHRRLCRLMEEERPTHLYCQLVRMAAYAGGDNHRMIRVLDYMDAFSKGYERLSGRHLFLRRLLARMEARRLKRYEKAVFDRFDHHVIISEQDRKLIPHPENDRIIVSPNGVDSAYFDYRGAEKQFDIVFAGNMSYPPNIESARFLASSVLPRLEHAGRKTSLVIAGASPAPEVLRLRNERITVTGWVDDIRAVVAAAKICAAPMFLSIGLQNKIIQAMAMQLPCVVSTLANNAIGAEPGRQILLADTPEEYEHQIAFLLDHPDSARSIGLAGREYVRQRFDWNAILDELSARIGA